MRRDTLPDDRRGEVCAVSVSIGAGAAGDVSPQLRQRHLSPVELTQAMLARIAQLDVHLNAYIRVTAESALADARCAEQEIARGINRDRCMASRLR
ncbi:glutamyl-tRNA amidotransferase [Burkholderia pseudomallei]|nr:glutamyl-tRNA amidotransferase [Burkholderia pseudomallei]MBM5578297.1 glutamyl-tRNA amidotransferase [Burkholderia pseudomallei]MBM5587421.1 glutamyl-tRNA amidotransferase [Burkholderia pseudomallei]RPA01040.1 glutamyl-tRNA amidotransferase [Burkholderia pseudomallei]